MIAHVGVTATRNGITRAQKAAARALLNKVEGTERWLHHGDCVGGDNDICEIARDLGFMLEAHPPTNPRLRAYIKSDIVMWTAPYAVRNADIVHSVSYLIAAPRQSDFQTRGGTWMTVELARRAGRIVDLIWPNGTVQRLKPFTDPKEIGERHDTR